jgi:hypothetical protein
MNTTHLIWNNVRLDRKNPTAPGFYLWASSEHAHVSAITVANPEAWANIPGFFCPLVPDPDNVTGQHTLADGIHAKPSKQN